MNESFTREELQGLKEDIFRSLHCAMPGQVVTFDFSTFTATIQPMIKTRSGMSLPLLLDVPVYSPLLGGQMTFDVSPGDFCLVIFADSAIDAWMMSGQESIPVSGRAHDLSDAFAFVGFHPVGG